jgi:biotin transport system substrate-specific component
VGGYSFSLQIGGVLLTACLAGPVAAVCAQIVYLGLGLAGLQVFAQGGGWQYLYQPAFGYLLGFLPAAWACGTMAFRQTDPHLPRASFPPRRNPYVQPSLSAPVRLQDLAAAGLVALTLVHLTGITYLLATQPWNGELLQLLRLYSGYTLPGQLIVVSFAALLALILRRLLLL